MSHEDKAGEAQQVNSATPKRARAPEPAAVAEAAPAEASAAKVAAPVTPEPAAVTEAAPAAAELESEMWRKRAESAEAREVSAVADAETRYAALQHREAEMEKHARIEEAKSRAAIAEARVILLA